MANPLLKTSKITAKGQTTVPDAVRQALRVTAGDRIAFQIDGDAVTLHRVEPEVGDPAMDSFLTFLANDLQHRPEAVSALSPDLAQRLTDLVGDLDVDLDAPIDGEVRL